MKSWLIIGKRVVRVDSESVELRLVCRRDGIEREAVVSGRTFDDKKIGDEVELRDDV